MSASGQARAGVDAPALRITGEGIVRAARRPQGWLPRGPRPAGDRGDPGLRPAAGEDLCFLAGDWRIFQRLDGHRWSLDDLVTAHAAVDAMRDRPPPRCFVDLGCGIGSVLLLLGWSFPRARGLGIEAQSISVALARRSLRYNGAGDRLEVRCADFRAPVFDDAEPCAGEGGFDLVTGTPPYFAPGAASESTLPQRGPCRIEHRGGIEEYCAAAARLLAPGAPFVVCAGGPDAKARGLRAAAASGLVVERGRAVVPRLGKEPLFWLFRMRRAGDRDDSHGSTTAAAPSKPSAAPRPLEPRFEDAPLIVRDACGARTPELTALRDAMGLPP